MTNLFSAIVIIAGVGIWIGVYGFLMINTDGTPLARGLVLLVGVVGGICMIIPGVKTLDVESSHLVQPEAGKDKEAKA